VKRERGEKGERESVGHIITKKGSGRRREKLKNQG
jgi:hypothetical protein